MADILYIIGTISVRTTARLVSIPILSGWVTTKISARVSGTNVPLLTGQITTGSASRVTYAQVPQLYGSILTTSTARAPGSNFPLLYGNILSTSTFRSAVNITPGLIGSISTLTFIRLSTASPALDLAGTITVNSAAKVMYNVILPFGGRITTSVSGTHNPYLGNFSGRIGIRTAISNSLFSIPIQLLAGRINSTSSAQVIADISGEIFLLGHIYTSSSARVFSGRFAPLAGTIISVKTNLAGFAGPYWVIPHTYDNLGGGTTRDIGDQFTNVGQPGSRIGIQVVASLLTSELLEPLPPYPPAFLTWPIDHYLNLITSEHVNKPKYVRTVATSLAPVVENQHLIAAIPGLFDLDYSQGQQEDFTGQWIGKSRWIELPNVFFSWDGYGDLFSAGHGWNQANWKDLLHDSTDKLQRLDDYHYRLLLYASVVANHWDGSIPGAYEAWDALFHYTGLKVVIQDYGNMTMLYGLLWSHEPDIVLISLFTTGQMDLKPEGIELVSYVFAPVPDVGFFAFDAESGSVSGWESGYWGILVPPGETL